jgi:c-di-GMP-binding flagellar brake protein YcgR
MIGFEDKSHRRRKHKRMPIVVLCEISAPETGKTLGKGCVLNFSRGGLSIVTPANLAWDSSVNITVDKLDQKEFVAAKVANFRPVMDGFYAYGLEFEGLNSLQRIRMVRIFKKLFRELLS